MSDKEILEVLSRCTTLHIVLEANYLNLQKKGIRSILSQLRSQIQFCQYDVQANEMSMFSELSTPPVEKEQLYSYADDVMLLMLSGKRSCMDSSTIWTRSMHG